MANIKLPRGRCRCWLRLRLLLAAAAAAAAASAAAAAPAAAAAGNAGAGRGMRLARLGGWMRVFVWRGRMRRRWGGEGVMRVVVIAVRGRVDAGGCEA